MIQWDKIDSSTRNIVKQQGLFKLNIENDNSAFKNLERNNYVRKS